MVMCRKFEYGEAADCFCGEKSILEPYRYSEDVMRFIEEAVEDALKKVS